MDRNPTTNEIIAGSGMLVWIIGYLFLPWYSIGNEFVRVTAAGSTAGGLRWLFFLLALGVIAFLVIQLTTLDLNLPIASSMVVLIAGIVMAAFTVLFAFLVKPGGVIGGIGPSWGVFVSLAGSLATVYGGFAMMGDKPETKRRLTSQPQAGWQPQQPGYPPQQPGYPPQQPGYPPQQPGYPPQQPPQQPGYPPQQPPGPPPQPGYPPQQPPQQPGQPPQQPGYPPQQPPGPPPQPGYPPQQPPQHPGYPPQQPPGPPPQPGYPPQQP